MKPPHRQDRILPNLRPLLASVISLLTASLQGAPTQFLETSRLRLEVEPDTGRYAVIDKTAGVTWRSHPTRFAETSVRRKGRIDRLNLGPCEAKLSKNALTLTFRPYASEPEDWVRVEVSTRTGPHILSFSFTNSPSLDIEQIRLLDEGLAISATENGYALAPVREGLLIPSNSGLAFQQRFDTYSYEGCHMAMVGAVKQGAAALLTWSDPYVAAEIRSVLMPREGRTNQTLTTSLVLRKSANSFQLHLLGKGDYVTVAKAYRDVARDRGWLVPWEQKLKGHPDRAKYFGASNFKLWSTLSRSMNDESTQEVSHQVNWTFDEAAQVAEHLKRDLQMDRVLFMMGGWIHRGYDNQHPDILPTAPECGGDDAFRDGCRRIRALGYVLSLHDNYQDIYRDSPSWGEEWVMKNPDGSLVKGGKWAGGRAYLTCSQKAVELARRPQNLVAVKSLSNADSYFIDTTYASGLMECFDPKHLLTRQDDMKWKQVISDYARDVFGSFGSECGREWAIPHSDFFEGLTGVSGDYYHNKDLVKGLGASVVPLFELVYRDCIAMYGKYGYDFNRAADYVLHHISLGRPLNYHSIPNHLYWKQPANEEVELALTPEVADFKALSTRRFEIAYHWTVEQAPAEDWRVFVHFTDAAGNIRFQNDHLPTPPLSHWKPGVVRQGPFTLTIPDGLTGPFIVRMGMFRTPDGPRALLRGRDNGERSYAVGRLTLTGDGVAFEATTPPPANIAAGDPALFVRGEKGWTQGLHPVDRFVKNTHEVLSPLNEITSTMQMTAFEFLTPDRKVARSVFGDGRNAVEVVVNRGSGTWTHRSRLGGSVKLPPFGFVVEGPTFAAFHTLNWAGKDYATPTLFTLRSLDNRNLADSRRLRIFHAFGDPAIRVDNREMTVPREEIVPH